MILGELIKQLQDMPAYSKVSALSNPHSYRGYYEKLAFEPCYGKTTTAGELLDLLSMLVGKNMHGYKGGIYKITNETEVIIAFQGDLGNTLDSIDVDGTFIVGDDYD